MVHNEGTGQYVACESGPHYVSELGHSPPAPPRAEVGSPRDVAAAQELEAFIQEHQRCGELDGGVEGERIWMTCACKQHAAAS